MADRERIVEVMAKAINDKHGPETMDEVSWEDADEIFREQYRDDMRFALAALEAAGYAIVERDKCEPWLGCATTRQLIEELTARIDVLGQLDYSTVGGTPGDRS